MRNYNVVTSVVVPNQGKHHTFYDMIILNLVEKWWDGLAGHFKQNYIIFTILWGKILHFSLLKIKYFFGISWVLHYSCLWYAAVLCVLYFGCFIFSYLFGIPISQLPYIEWLIERKDHGISWEVLSGPEIWPKRINGTIKQLKDNFYDAPLLRKTILYHISFKMVNNLKTLSGGSPLETN